MLLAAMSEARSAEFAANPAESDERLACASSESADCGRPCNVRLLFIPKQPRSSAGCVAACAATNFYYSKTRAAVGLAPRR